ncbi:MAG: hypothetical protein MUC38_03375 [Cyclobacteriaceae bacterium]|jgi:hypothetical protein|nr:hypothetical protein [Cyclobacteriaceae bacterium]
MTEYCNHANNEDYEYKPAESNSTLVKSRCEKKGPFGLGLFLFAMYALACHPGLGQPLAFGPVFQIYQPSVRGGAEAGDVIILSDPTTPNREPSVGVFVSRKVSSYLQVSLSINYSQQFYSFMVFNQAEQCAFCPVRKSASLAVNNFDVAPTLKLQVFKTGNLRFFLVGGGSIQFRTEFRPMENEDISFGNKHPGVAEIINQMDDVHKPVGLYVSYGAAAHYGRFIFQLCHQSMISHSFTSNLYLNSTPYPFNVDISYVTLSLQYQLYSLKMKKSRGEKVAQ